jgi:hypothetical protein
MSSHLLSFASLGFSICMFCSVYELRQKNIFSKHNMIYKTSVPPELKLIICSISSSIFIYYFMDKLDK